MANKNLKSNSVLESEFLDTRTKNVLVSLAAGASEVANLYSVTYNTNNSTAGTTPPTQSAMSDSTSYGFTAPTAEQYGLSKAGYEFAGWAEDSNAALATYAPGANIVLNSSSPSKTLYAIWGYKYTLTYNLNGGTGTTPSWNNIVARDPYEIDVVGQDGFSRSGYKFLGWADSNSATSAQYTSGGTGVTVSKSTPNKTIYAVWKENPFGGITTMQEMTPAACSDSYTGQSGSLTDIRDQKSYLVTKLSDGNCWMTQNLAIDLTGKTLTSADSDVSSNWSPVSAWGTTANTVAWQISTTGSEHTSYGGYYTWQAATAGTAPVNTSSAGWPEASGSICPRGWELPTGNAGQFKALVDKGKSSWTSYNGINGYWLGGTGNVAGAAFFPAGGLVNNGSLGNAGSYGYYWSSTASNASSAYFLYFYSSGVAPSNDYYRCYGFSVRCVAR